jgi:hypothetical protein
MPLENPSRPALLLRNLGLLARLGVASLVIAMVGGTTASGIFLYIHHQNRDERPGLTLDDVRAHYHGIVSEAPLLMALRANHPDTLDERDRDALIGWLEGDPNKLGQVYDSFDLGEDAPAEIIAVNCLSCHARSASGPDAAPEMPLDYWDDVRGLAISRDVQPVSIEILAASTHTHALGMASVGIAIALLALLTSWPRALTGGVLAIAGIGLVADLAGWWLTRQHIGFAYAIVAGGAAFNGGVGVLGLLILGDLCMPKPKTQPAA